MTIQERIKLALSRSGKSQTDLAKRLDKHTGTVSEMLSKESDIDSIAYVRATAELTGFSFEWLRTGEGPEQGSELTIVQESSNKYLEGKDVRPVTVTVNPSGEELVSYVPVKAQAGYMKGYGDPHYIERLPAFTLPGVVKNGTFRMFEVDGDSMLQLGNKGLRSGEIVIARYVEDIFDMKDNRVYVVISTEGTAIKRVLNRLRDKENPCLVMTSDNKNGQHPSYILKPKQIKEVWEAKRYISSDFSFDTNLYEILGDIQVEQARLKEKVDELSRKK